MTIGLSEPAKLKNSRYFLSTRLHHGRVCNTNSIVSFWNILWEKKRIYWDWVKLCFVGRKSSFPDVNLSCHLAPEESRGYVSIDKLETCQRALRELSWPIDTFDCSFHCFADENRCQFIAYNNSIEGSRSRDESNTYIYTNSQEFGVLTSSYLVIDEKEPKKTNGEPHGVSHDSQTNRFVTYRIESQVMFTRYD